MTVAELLLELCKLYAEHGDDLVKVKLPDGDWRSVEIRHVVTPADGSEGMNYVEL